MYIIVEAEHVQEGGLPEPTWPEEYIPVIVNGLQMFNVHDLISKDYSIYAAVIEKTRHAMRKL